MHQRTRKIDIELIGTTHIPVAEFKEKIEDKFNNKDSFKFTVINQENGFTYKITVHDIIDVTTKDNGEVEITYFDVMNKEVAYKTTLPDAFTVTTITDTITPMIRTE